MELGIPLTLLQKTATALGTAAAKKSASKFTFRFRVSRQAGKEARSRGFTISNRAIRRWLTRADTSRALVSADAAVASSASRALGLTVGDRPTGPNGSDAALMDVVLEAYLSCLPEGAGNAAGVAWTKAEAQATRDEVKTHSTKILDRIDARTDFDDGLATMHPWRAETARSLQSSVSAVEKVVSLLHSSQNRRTTLSDWSTSHPEWMSADPNFLAWLGSLSFDYDAREAGVRFINAGLANGLSPRSYWVARREMGSHEASVHGLEVPDDETDHPLRRGLANALQGDNRQAAADFQSWNTSTPEDEAIRLQLLARLIEQIDSTSSAIGLIEPTAEGSHASGQMMLAAELLLRRGVLGNSISRLADAERALALALRARNQRRGWFGDSTSAALLALKAAHLSGQTDRAWSITQPPPEGEATLSESRDPRMTAAAASTAAMTGRTTLAKDLITKLEDAFEVEQVSALIAIHEDDQGRAELHWRAAWHAATEPADQLMAAVGLAELGILVEGLDQLSESFPEKVREVRDIAAALSSPGDPITSLRAHAHKSPRIALELAERLHSIGQMLDAAQVLHQAAERWRNAQLYLMASDSYRKGGQHDKSIEAANAAINLGGPSWPGQTQARAIMLEVYASQGRYDLAAEQGRAMLARDPQDVNAQWALVKCLLRRGSLREAWDALVAGGRPAKPRFGDEAVCWIVLYSRFSTDADAVSNALNELEPWIDDERVAGAFLVELMTHRRDEVDPMPEDQAKRYRDTLESYQSRFPDSPILRAIPMGPDEDPLAPMREQLRSQHRDLGELIQKVVEGELPIGLLADATGKPYAEISLGRPSPALIASPNNAPGDVVAITESVVVDTTSLGTLTALDSRFVDVLLSRFAQVVSSDLLYLDAVRAREQLDMRSSLRVGWDPTTERETVTEIPDEVLEEQAARGAALQFAFKRTMRLPWHELKHFPNEMQDCAWLSPVDICLESGRPFWVDDAVLRGLAESLGVTCFSTADLLDALRAEGSMSVAEVEACKGKLIFEGYADLGFEPAAATHAADLASWAPAGAALMVANARSWTDPDAVVAFVLSAVDRVAGQHPDQLEGWIYSAARGLIVIAGSQEAASDNLKLLLAKVILRASIGAAQVPFVLSGIRRAREGTEIAEPLEPLLQELYSTYAQHLGHAMGSKLLMAKMSLCSTVDKTTAARVILTTTTTS